MGVIDAGAALSPLPFSSPAFDQFLSCLDTIQGTSPMDRALKIADAMDSPSIRAAFLPRVGDFKGSIQWHRALVGNPGHLNPRVVLESLIQMVERDEDTTIADVRAIKQEWWTRFGLPLVAKQQPHTNNRDPERQLVVGYVSANWKHSSAGNCLEAVVLNHSDAVRAICYNTNPPAYDDPATWTFQARTQLINISALSEAEFAARVRADGVDILIDCMGFTYGNQLGAFCERPAPIQATGWGYATGTIPAMDVVFLDAITAGQDAFFERVVHLPCVISYVAPAMFLPPVAPQPTGPVTFGAFHCFIKLSPSYLALCRRILDRVPGSRIVFKGKEYGEAELRSRITDVLGVDHCEFWPQTLQLDHLSAFKHIDLVLDPFPQTGGITTCEALLMGVPSITWQGPRTIQRAAASILTAVGFSSGVTYSADGYVDQAVTFATTHRTWLAECRPRWRSLLLQSRIVKGYVPAVEAVYRDLWREWCANGPTSAA